MPPAEALPRDRASLREIIHFAWAYDPTEHFLERWGENYKAKVEALWHGCVQSFLAGTPAAGEADELLLCLVYDCVLGPGLGVPESLKEGFLRWLVDGIRRALGYAA